jgi:hypothetical protein
VIARGDEISNRASATVSTVCSAPTREQPGMALAGEVTRGLIKNFLMGEKAQRFHDRVPRLPHDEYPVSLISLSACDELTTCSFDIMSQTCTELVATMSARSRCHIGRPSAPLTVLIFRFSVDQQGPGLGRAGDIPDSPSPSREVSCRAPVCVLDRIHAGARRFHTAVHPFEVHFACSVRQ